MVRAHPRLNRNLTVAAFALSAISTVVVLFLLASAEPFERHGPNAPSVLWSILLWGMVGIGTWVVFLRLVILLLVPVAGLLYRRSGDTAASPPSGGPEATAGQVPGAEAPLGDPAPQRRAGP